MSNQVEANKLDQTEKERLEGFERVLQAVKEDQKQTIEKLTKLSQAGKTNTATFKQLFAKKLTNENTLSLFKIYGDIE